MNTLGMFHLSQPQCGLDLGASFHCALPDSTWMLNFGPCRTDEAERRRRDSVALAAEGVLSLTPYPVLRNFSLCVFRCIQLNGFRFVKEQALIRPCSFRGFASSVLCSLDSRILSEVVP